MIPIKYSPSGTSLKPVILYDLTMRDNRRISPYVNRIKCSLIYKQIPYTTIPWKMTDKDVLPLDNWKNSSVKPGGKVPVLVDPNRNIVVQDSLRIAKYLELEYSDRPSLFRLKKEELHENVPSFQMAQQYAQLLHQHLDRNIIGALGPYIINNIYELVCDEDKKYFWDTRGVHYGGDLKKATETARSKGPSSFQRSLASIRETIRSMGWMSGKEIGFFDFQVYGIWKWAESVDSEFMKNSLKDNDPVKEWVARMDSWVVQNGGHGGSKL